MPVNMERDPRTGLSILVVGGGIAGLCFAIEAYRKGHNVRVVERRAGLDPYGDIIVIQSSALRTPQKWPGFMDRARSLAYAPFNHMKKYDGTFIMKLRMGPPEDPALPMNRCDLHKVLYEYALDVGVSVQFDVNVVEYLETSEAGSVLLDDGRSLEADIVVAADGVGSKAWKLVTGHKEQPISSGFALYRVTFPAEPALRNPVIAEEFQGQKDHMGLFFGPDVHSVIGKTERDIFWTVTHRVGGGRPIDMLTADKKQDDGNAEEDWAKAVPIEKALPYVDGWTPFLTELIKSTPDGTCTDWKLMWRNPQPKMVSPQGRVVQIGDAAHAFLPTSGSGATMAMEDSFALATCLQIVCRQGGEKVDVPLALRVFNLLRFERVACAQKLGFHNREALHKTDWEALEKEPGGGPGLLRKWLQNHDPELYAHEMFESAANHLLHGTPFVNTNTPPGYEYKPWTIQELLAASNRGEKIEDEGDWS